MAAPRAANVAAIVQCSSASTSVVARTRDTVESIAATSVGDIGESSSRIPDHIVPIRARSTP